MGDMVSSMPRTALALILLGALVGASSAAAHPVTVDGSPAEWSTRSPNADTLGIVARDAAGSGELIWRDALADTRTDLSTPEVVGEIAAFQVTGTATGVAFLVRRTPGVVFAGAPIQIQIAIDTDRMDGSGQEFFGQFADTRVANGARWERLVQTLFGSGGAASVLDTGFNQVAMAPAMQGASGDVEIFVPWTALGLNAPPATPLRFTVATFRAQPNDVTVDIGGPQTSNALDAVTDYGDPRAAMHPNTFQEVQDLTVDYSFDVYFAPNGEVYAPLVVQRFLPNSVGGGSDEWYAVTNVSPEAFALGAVKLGDEETPDGAEGMFVMPTASLAAGATYIVARGGASYQAFYGVAPNAELPPGATMAVPDLTAYPAWTSAPSPNLQLANGGDEVLILDRSNIILDVATFGTGVYSGITTFTPAPASNEVLSRNGASADSDNCQVDFSNSGVTCTANAQCGGACFECVANSCQPKMMGAACPNANPCDGDEICDGSGVCVGGTTPPCDDMNPCTTDTCSPATGCMNTDVPAGTSCADADVCNGAELCDANGMCGAGSALDCDDANDCTADTCDAVAGCANADQPMGSACEDGDVCTTPDSCDGAGTCVPGTEDGCGGTGGTGGASASGGPGGSGGSGGGGIGGQATGGAGTGASSTGGAATGGNSAGGDSPDGGNGVGGDGANGGGGGADGDASDDGCSCRTVDTHRSSTSPWLAAAVMALVLARRTRRR